VSEAVKVVGVMGFSIDNPENWSPAWMGYPAALGL